MKQINNTIYNVICQYTGEQITFNKFPFISGRETNDSDCDGIMIRKYNGEYWKRNYQILDVKMFGAIADGSDDTIGINKAINFCYKMGGGDVQLRDEIYCVKEVNLLRRVSLVGKSSNKTKLRFRPSDNIVTDSLSYVLRWTGGLNKVKNLTLDGYNNGSYSVGNAMYVIPDATDGLQRKIQDLRIEYFAGNSAIAGIGTYGMNKNFSREQISNGTGVHLVQGGNGIVIEKNNNPAWEFEVDKLNVFGIDGVGINVGKASDSKFNNIFIGACMGGGFVAEENNKNLQGNNIKVYLCRVLNLTDGASNLIQKLIPHELNVGAESEAAVVLTGENHQFKNFETQENGSHGFKFGTFKYSLSNSYIDLNADGNGGFDNTTDSTGILDYKRFGILGVNYYNIKVTGICNDFRAKFGLGRQLRAFHTISSRKKFYFADLIPNNYYRIGKADTTDFTRLQLGYNSKSNAIGTIFQLRVPYLQGLSYLDFGTDYLEAVNDYLDLDIIVCNQYEVDTNTGLGYNLTNDGQNGIARVNGEIVFQKKSSLKELFLNLLRVKNIVDSPDGLEIGGIGTSSGRQFFSSDADLSNGFSIRKNGDNLVISTEAQRGVTSGIARWFFSNTGLLTPASDASQNLGSPIFQFLTGYFRNIYINAVKSKSGEALVMQTDGANSFILNQNSITTLQSYGDGRVVVGNVTVNPTSATFTVNSTTKGMLTPRMTKANRLAIVLPEEGLKVYQIQETGIETEAGEYVYKKTGWTKIV